MECLSDKNNSLNWFKGIPSDWVKSRIKYIKSQNKYSLVDGPFGSDLKSEHFTENGKVVVIESGFITKGKYFQTRNFKKISEEHFEKVKRSECFPQDIIIAKIGEYFGMSSILPDLNEKTLISGNCCKLSVSKENNVKFIHYFLLFLRNIGFIQREVNQTGQPFISLDVINNLPVLIPTKNEQNLIADYLDQKTKQIDSLIGKIGKKIELLNEQKNALINQYVTKGLNSNVAMKDSGVVWIGEIPKHWEITKLKYESDLIVDGSHFTPNYVEDGVPFLRVTDLTYKNISLDKVKFISYSEHSELSKRCHPKKGDLLLSKNGTIGKTRIVDWDWDFSIFVSLCLIRLKDEFSSNLLSLFFESNLFDTQIKEGSKQSTVINLHLDKIREFVLIKPPIKEQNLIVRRVKESIDPIFNLNKLEEQKLSLLREYRQSLISSVVTGKIRITEDMI